MMLDEQQKPAAVAKDLDQYLKNKKNSVCILMNVVITH